MNIAVKNKDKGKTLRQLVNNVPKLRGDVAAYCIKLLKQEICQNLMMADIGRNM
jgi:hypothetical protein